MPRAAVGRLPAGWKAGVLRPPWKSSSAIDVRYATQTFRRHPGDLAEPAWRSSPNSRRISRDQGLWCRWIRTAGSHAHSRGGEHPATDRDSFVEYARTLGSPDVYELVRQREPLTEVVSHSLPCSRRLHYEDLSRFPEGYLVLGDAACSFNPVYGHGMTTAALQASVLDEVLARRSDSSLSGISRLISAAWRKRSRPPGRWRPARIDAINRPRPRRARGW